MKTLVIIPTFNEAENVSAIIDEVLLQNNNLEVLIVDDNSPDGTSELVKTKQKKIKRLHLLEREGKLGLGSAYVAGFKYALENDYDYIFEMDADFSHDPKDIPRILKEMEYNDLVIGSRYIKGINVVNWPLRRLLLSFFAAQYARFITGMRINDPTGGFKCFRREVLANINLDDILSDGYSFQIEMNFRTWVKKFRIKEIPIVFTDRRSGQSKMSKKIVREAIIVVWKLKYYKIKKRIT
ncbi:MAG: polyprenol monophosphomannose synthase [Candidatus Cloacimonetes bacterium]|nr:polyprenol monophosphomannose synthase [Candidatus Cloacimonadota bacterium]